MGKISIKIEADLSLYLKGEKTLIEVIRKYKLNRFKAQKMIHHIILFGKEVDNNWLYNLRMGEVELYRLKNFTTKQISKQLF